MDDFLLNLFLQLPPLGKLIVLIVCPIIILAKGWCASTPTPPPNTLRGQLYRLIEMAAMLVGKAKEIGVPVPTAMTLESAIMQESVAAQKSCRPFSMENVVKALSSAAPVLIIFVCLSMSGCSFIAQLQMDRNTVTQFALTDLQAAQADAQANGDAVATACYAALFPVVQAQAKLSAATAASGTANTGVISAFQSARDIKLATAGTGQVGVACAPLAQQVKSDVLDLGKLFGVP